MIAAILLVETSLPATRPHPSSLLCLIIFPQQPNQFGHARPVGLVICSGVIRRIKFVGRSAALSRLRKQVSQLHFLLRPQVRRKSESHLASDLNVDILVQFPAITHVNSRAASYAKSCVFQPFFKLVALVLRTGIKSSI